MKRKGLGILTTGTIILLGALGITVGMFIYWLFTFKIHIFQRIIEEYHYNRVQEIPLTIISSDYEGESFVEKFNKAYYGFYSENEIKNFKETVKSNTTAQVGEAYWWSLIIKDLYFGRYVGEGCTAYRDVLPGTGEVPNVYVCICSDKCPRAGEIAIKDVEDVNCNDSKVLAFCLGSLTVNITFFNDTFPFPLTFNGGNEFITKMVFNAYA